MLTVKIRQQNNNEFLINALDYLMLFFMAELSLTI